MGNSTMSISIVSQEANRHYFSTSKFQLHESRVLTGCQGVAEARQVLAASADTKHEKHERVGRHFGHDAVPVLQYLGCLEACTHENSWVSAEQQHLVPRHLIICSAQSAQTVMDRHITEA